MAKSSYSEYLLQVLQRPPEVFSGIIRLERELYASRIYLRRCRKIDAPELRELMLKNRDYLEKWIQPQPEAITLNCVTDLITEDRILAKKGLRLDLGIFRIEDDKMLGRIALHSVDFGIQRSAGVSYWVDEEETNNGYATEALATLVSFAFEEISLHKIWLKINFIFPHFLNSKLSSCLLTLSSKKTFPLNSRLLDPTTSSTSALT